MIKQDGSNGKNAPRAFRVEFRCAGCGLSLNYDMKPKPGQPPAAAIPALRCMVCPGMPLLWAGPPIEIPLSLIQTPVLIPPTDLRKRG